MDIIQTQDRAVATETPRHKEEKKDKERLRKTPSSSNGLNKIEKKKSESKKLKKKLAEIGEQNESLSKRLHDKNAEIDDLRKSVNSLNDILNSVPIDELRCNSSIASNKILELSKKNRQIRAELETTKNNLTKKDIKIRKLEKDMKIMQEKLHEEVESVKKVTPTHEMQTKLNALQQKLYETRNKNSELQTQLKLAQKCLQQEIGGEHFNLNILAAQSSTSNWRGRAQQIIHLQQKIQQLKERLEAYEQHQISVGNIMPTFNVEIPQGVGYNLPISVSGSLSSIERPNVRKTEILHRAKVETLEKEITSLNSQLEDHRNKILALKVRNKTLNDDISRYKMKTNNLEEQTDFNSINMATMNDKLNEQKCHYEKQIEELEGELKNLLKQRQDMEDNIEYLKSKMEELIASNAGKDDQIEELNLVVKRLEDDLKAICGGFLFSCREFRKEEFITILDTLEAEKNSLLEHNKILNERINEERNKNDQLHEQLSKNKIRISRLEVKVRDLDRELDAQTEKKKRIQRIAEYTNSLSNMCSTTSLNSFTFENTSFGNSHDKSNSEEDIDSNIVELKNRLELANEKIAILQQKLDHITTEKENDQKTFQEIFDNSKNLILDMIEAQRNDICSKRGN